MSPKVDPKQDATEENPMNEDVYGLMAREDMAERRSLRVSLAIAGVAHLFLLLLTIPEIYSKEVEPPPPPERLILAQTPRFRPPPPPPEHIPAKRVKRLPMPDPDPEGPEPLRIDEVEVVEDFPDIDELPLDIPNRPPEPAQTGPLQAGVGGVTAPQRLTAPQPQYTEVARRARLQGPVILQTIINKQGEVTAIKVLKPLGLGLSEAAVAAVKNWTFTPATLRGKPVEVYYHLTVNFQLN